MDDRDGWAGSTVVGCGMNPAIEGLPAATERCVLVNHRRREDIHFRNYLTRQLGRHLSEEGNGLGDRYCFQPSSAAPIVWTRRF